MNQQYQDDPWSLDTAYKNGWNVCMCVCVLWLRCLCMYVCVCVCVCVCVIIALCLCCPLGGNDRRCIHGGQWAPDRQRRQACGRALHHGPPLPGRHQAVDVRPHTS